MITEEMKNHFDERTNEHIHRVQKYAAKLCNAYKDELSDLIRITNKHDKSKFSEPEYTPYLVISWSYKCKFKGIDFDVPEDMKSKMLKATTHHVLTNPHHPEFWSENRNPINSENRDKPKELIDATTMPTLYLAEMVADWSAMAEEYKNTEGPYKWAEDNINIRWKFSDKQVKLIYEFIDFLWKDN